MNDHEISSKNNIENNILEHNTRTIIEHFFFNIYPSYLSSHIEKITNLFDSNMMNFEIQPTA